MKILALETTDPIGTVAVSDNDNLLLEIDLNPMQRSAQSLAPGIKTLLDKVDWKPRNIELVALTIGPGSFTGLRVGLTLGKVFAYAVGAKILGVDTLETIAQAAPNGISELTVAIDAQRGDIVVRSFQRGTNGRFVPLDKQRLLAIDLWIEELTPGTIVSGPIIGKLANRLPDTVRVLEQKFWPPRASFAASLAYHQYSAGCRDDLWSLLPHYSRLSAAEEKLAKHGKP